MCMVKEIRKDQWKISDPDNWGDNHVYIRAYESGGIEVHGMDYVPMTVAQVDVIITTLFLVQARAKKLACQSREEGDCE